jgi:hypothetical protein
VMNVTTARTTVSNPMDPVPQSGGLEWTPGLGT